MPLADAPVLSVDVALAVAAALLEAVEAAVPLADAPVLSVAVTVAVVLLTGVTDLVALGVTGAGSRAAFAGSTRDGMAPATEFVRLT